METEHIVPASQGGPDTIDNAIPLCLECYAEVHLYNDKHPTGRKYHPDELKKHKEQWLKICRDAPQVLIRSPIANDPGPALTCIRDRSGNCHRIPVSIPSQLDQPSNVMSNLVLTNS